MFWRLLFIFLFLYWGIRAISKLLQSDKPNQRVHGKPRQDKSLDISDSDVEEVDFKEIKD